MSVPPMTTTSNDTTTSTSSPSYTQANQPGPQLHLGTQPRVVVIPSGSSNSSQVVDLAHAQNAQGSLVPQNSGAAGVYDASRQQRYNAYLARHALRTTTNVPSKRPFTAYQTARALLHSDPANSSPPTTLRPTQPAWFDALSAEIQNQILLFKQKASDKEFSNFMRRNNYVGMPVVSSSPPTPSTSRQNLNSSNFTATTPLQMRALVNALNPTPTTHASQQVSNLGMMANRGYAATRPSISHSVTSASSSSTPPTPPSLAPPPPPPLPFLAPPPLPTPTPHTPPNWLDHHDDTLASFSPYKLFPVVEWSQEYKVLATMLHPVDIGVVEQVVNPDLWTAFVDKRKGMLTSKSDNLDLLRNLGMDEKKLTRCAQMALMHVKDLAVEGSPYRDNFALLFHCTRSAGNIDAILGQGLDERVGHAGGGSLGKGIYFADNPIKAMQYDASYAGVMLVFGVLLGDCLSVDHLPNKNTFVREPEKTEGQKRNFNDKFFDSIVARPKGKDNEYVIYNRSQCCPLYKVQYQRRRNKNTNIMFPPFRQQLPPLAWIPPSVGKDPLPSPTCGQGWPFFARYIFSKMGVQESPMTDSDSVLPSTPQTIETSVSDKLKTLVNLGFYDLVENRDTLKKFKYDLDQCVNHMLDHDPPIPMDISLPTTPKKKKNDTIPVIDIDDDDDPIRGPSTSPPEECPICYDDFATTTSVTLKCSHQICTACHGKIETTRTTMSGITRTFVRCPCCQDITGILIGDCPTGCMKVAFIPAFCEGHESSGSIAINYVVSDVSYRVNRTAFLPNNDEGRDILALLRVAWDRRLCFTIGMSNTTRAENVLVWNIHHKTARRGGSEAYGWPDPGYGDRVRGELKGFGIQWEDLFGGLRNE